MAILICASGLVLSSIPALAQLSGTYTVGSGGSNYATIDLAISALTSNGVSGPVTFLIASGTYTPPAGGWTLPAVTGMSSTNTVTFKPASGATVTIAGTTNSGTGVFTIDGGDYYIIDGSNSSGGTTRDMTIRQTSTIYGAAVWIRNDADYNVVKNSIIQSQNGTTGVSVPDGGVTLFVGQSNTSSGNDSNTVQNNLVGDPNGVYRGYRAIYVYGASTSVVNVGTKIIGNDVVNFGVNGNQANSFGIFISYHNTGAIVRGNTVRMTTASGTTYSQAYGIYVNEQFASPNGNSTNVTIEGNRVYGLQTTGSASELIYPLAYFGDYNTATSTVRITNNMFAVDRGSTTATYYGMYVSVTSTSSTVYIDHNTSYLAGSSTSGYMLYANPGTTSIYHRNNVYYSTATSNVYGVYVASTSGWYSDNNLLTINTSGSGAYTGYVGGAQRSFNDFQTASSPQEANSVTGTLTFTDVSTADLHVSTVLPAKIESMGQPLSSVPLDYDLQTRNTVTPDIGADEGNFNGGGIEVTFPSGGEMVLAEGPMTVRFTLTRPLVVNIDMSLNNGASWSRIATGFSGTTGNNEYTFITPDVASTQGKIRVLSTVNQYEGDTSSGVFSFVRPTVTIVSPNGGEQLSEGQTYSITWTSTDVPSDRRVALDVSSDGGGTWTQIATNLASVNVPSINSYGWFVPSMRTTNALVRVRMLDKDIYDISDGPFSIYKALNLLYPVGGERLYAGDSITIRWFVPRVMPLTIELSTDGGGTWTQIFRRVPSSWDSIRWVVPAMPTTEGLIRISDGLRPQFSDESPAPFSIVVPSVHLIVPNGGERYEPGTSIPVRWTSQAIDRLRLEFSPDMGTTWILVDDEIDAAAGSYWFAPPISPARRALVRISSLDRPWVSDVSDEPFEVLEAPGIQIYTPAPPEDLMAGSIYAISWRAARIALVNIDYSSDGGGTWVRVASNLDSRSGTYPWRVPLTTTWSGRIRISDAQGAVSTMTGLFSIVVAVPMVRILTPNGGEQYLTGDTIVVSWTAANIATVDLAYTSDGGGTWQPIMAGVPMGLGLYRWVAPNVPGDQYRVRATSGAIVDESDGNFTIERRLYPALTVSYPNGGETFMVDSLETLRWTAVDITGDVDVAVSLDSGATWTTLATLPSTTQTYDWQVIDQETRTALVRVSSGATDDMSDGVFAIERAPEASITVTEPNDGEIIWYENSTVTIAWTAANVTAVDIALSTDGGASWGIAIATGVPVSPSSRTWRVPHLSDTALSSLLVRVSSSGQAWPNDISDQPFGFEPLGAGVRTGAAAGMDLTVTPNPGREEMTIRWEQPRSGSAELTMVDAAGRVVLRRGLGDRPAGRQSARIDAREVAAGTYTLEVRTTAGRTTRRVVLLPR